MQLTTRKRFIITFIPIITIITIITNSTIENRTYIWYNRNILYETMYMSLRFMKKGKQYIIINTLLDSVHIIQINR
ncbi:hypothetical protein CN980_23855 [Bacillus cereus]|uniref:Uncharacterized protein n=1 Tax=Bacillus cereus TaxID=1396 RepID=A0A9X7C7U9_BACCE|nr:hypothetical protein CN980_23855 [Bacillus cereus]